MKHVMDILQRELVYENQCHSDAIEYLNGGTLSPMKGTEDATRKAFLVSKELSEDRIPQIVAAITILNKGWDSFANAPKEDYNGNRPAFKTNVI